MKYCKRCDTSKAPEMFGKLASSKDGLYFYCRECVRGINKAKYLADPGRAKEDARRWQATNREKYLGVVRRAAAKYASKNPEKVRAATKRWMQANPLKRQVYDALKKARRKTRAVTWDNELDALVRLEARHLVALRRAATGVDWHVDHIVPLLAKEACGLDNPFNLAVVPAAFNVWKKNRMVPQPGFVLEARV